MLIEVGVMFVKAVPQLMLSQVVSASHSHGVLHRLEVGFTLGHAAIGSDEV
jgi:hypothetical protein